MADPQPAVTADGKRVFQCRMENDRKRDRYNEQVEKFFCIDVLENAKCAKIEKKLTREKAKKETR